MKVVDANVLLYAVNRSAAHHASARGWLDAALGSTETVGFSWVVLLAFLRLSTKVGLFPSPLLVDEANERVADWLSQPSAVVLEPTPRHHALLAGLLAAGTGGNLVNDAHLAALALEHGGTVVSYDTDFARFEGVAVQRPVEPEVGGS